MFDKILCIHHTAIGKRENQFQEVVEFHKKKFNVPNTAYHVFINKNGSVIHANSKDRILPHAGSKEWNEKSFAVCLAGDFTQEIPTEEQLQSLYLIWKDAGYPRIVYHSDIRSTFCPGRYNFRAALNEYRVMDLPNRLLHALKALPRFVGTLRGSTLERMIKRIRSLLPS